MVTRELKSKEELVVVDRHCNKCGVSCKNGEWGFEGLLDATVRGGYGSTYPGDLTYVEFDLCPKCVEELVKTFTIPVEMKDMIFI